MGAMTPKLFTMNLTNADSPFTFKATWGFQKINILNTHATLAITITGSARAEAYTSEAVSITAGQSLVVGGQFGVDDFTITIPSGATCSIIAE